MRTLVCCAFLLITASPACAADDPVRTAVEKGLHRLEEGAANYTRNRQCFSCHHQAIPLAAFDAARGRGLSVDEEEVRRQVEFTLDSFRPQREKIAKGQGVPGGNIMAGYGLFTLEMGGAAPDEVSAALLDYLLARQKPDGSWPAQAGRPPMQASDFTSAYLALRALKAYGPLKDAKDAGDLRRRVDTAYEKGRQWLLSAKPRTTEDRSFALQALAFVGAGREQIEPARDALIKEQRDDGGWAQLPERGSDAYATGTVLTALGMAGVPADDEAYQKGVQYLLKTQRDDGGWVVETRSPPVQKFFDNGDPGGKSQFISFPATAWAVIALLEAYPTP